jgi:hypothetical protein
MLEAAHIIPDEHKGTDDPRNGLVLCSNHHRAFDKGLLRISPETLEFAAEPPLDLDTVKVSRTNLKHLVRRPHPAALKWRWDSSAARSTAKP